MKNYLFLAIQLLATLAYSQKYHVNEDFNNSALPSGWTNNAVSGTQAWSFGIDGANLHSGNQNLDGTPMAFFDDDVLGQASNNNTAELITPSFNNSAESYTYLTFDYNFREAPNYANTSVLDSLYVDIYDGSQWQNVFSVKQNDCGNYVFQCAVFPSALIDISAYANDSCQIRFTYHDGNDWGFYVGIDNVEIWSPYANDLSVNKVVNPKNGCGLGASDSIQVLITNPGYSAQQNFDIAFELNGNPAIVETVTDSIAYQDSLIYTFNNTGNFSSFGMQNLKVYTLLANDSVLTNDTLSAQISNDSAYQAPYFNDFESINNGWTASGTNSSWAWGVPAGNVIDTAHSGQNAWVTNLTGNYNRRELSYLNSHCFDFSQENEDPIFSFQLNYNTETFFDRLWIEYSIDFGQNWQKIPNSVLSKNWYNVTSRQTWEGNSNGWIKVTNLLSNLAGEPQVNFRFVFESDGGTQYEGIGIDDISITERHNKDLAINEINYPTNSILCGLGNAERITFEYINFGNFQIDTFQVFYQIDNLPIDSETVITIVDSLSIYTHTSQLTFDFSQQKNYTLKTWIKIFGDSNQNNDTLIHVFNNSLAYSSITVPYYENFDGFNNGAANQYGWEVNPVSQNVGSFGWRANSGLTLTGSLPGQLTGPSGDHTSGIGKYIYLETSQIGSDATFESSCFNFQEISGVILSFWYHRYGVHIQPLQIDYYYNGNWINIETITQKPQTSSNSPWTYHEIILPIGGIISKIRFKGSEQGTYGDVAIDDVRIDPTHVQINNLSETSFCDDRTKLPISLELINKTLVDLGQDSLLLSYTINGQQTFYDTLHQSLNSGDTTYFTFSDSIDLTQYGEVISVDIMNSHIDSNLFWGDTVHFDFYQAFINKNFTEDFESYAIGNFNSSLWFNNENWLLINDTINNSTTLANHTFNGRQFLHNISNDTHDVRLESICMNTSDADSLDLLFWYNIQGTASSKLYIYDHSDTAVVIIDSIVGSSPSGQWQRKRINLTAYLDSSFALGFRFVDTNQNLSTTISLDDIQLLEQAAPYNLRTNEMEVSVNGCSYGNGNVFITVENIGLDSIPANAIKTYYQIDQNTAVRDSISQAIAPGRSITHQFSNPAALNQPGNTYNIKTWTSLNGDTQQSDDTLATSITNQTKVDSLFEDFEGFAHDSCWSTTQENEILINGWSTTNHSWAVHNTVSCFDSLMNGPIADHTLGSGQYIYANNLANRRELELFTPCVDISQLAQPNLAYWVYTNLASTDTFKVEVNANGNWKLIDSIYGADSSGAWVNRSVDLTAYKAASPIQIRFTGIIDGFKLPVLLAIDDISIADSLTTSLKYLKSAAVNYKLYPNPSEGQFTLDVDQSFIGELYQIRELSGKLIQEGKINSNKNHIQLNENAKGIYFLSVPNKNIREKVVVY